MADESNRVEQLVILGSTGSIGRYSLDVIARHPNRFSVFALVAHTNVEIILTQIIDIKPEIAILTDLGAANRLKDQLAHTDIRTKVYAGWEAVIDAVINPKVSTVISAITGAAGLQPTLAACVAGKRILLANKESLVMAGALFNEALNQHGGMLLPIDSEHNAIFQVLPDNYQQDPEAVGIRRVCLTASGGALRDYPIDQLDRVTPEMALKHPNWSMGHKVTIDSATMMNKGLELIEASWLFNLPSSMLDVVIHPQSIIHSMVEYLDGSQLAQMGHADMRTPIAQALAYPDRITSGVQPLCWETMGNLTFDAVDPARYPCLGLARSAMNIGGTMPAILNAANEVAVAAFLSQLFSFTDIAKAVDATMMAVEHDTMIDLHTIEQSDRQARKFCQHWIANHS